MVDDDNIEEDNDDEEHLVSLNSYSMVDVDDMEEGNDDDQEEEGRGGHLVSLRYSSRRLDIDLRAAVVLLVSGNT